MEAGQGDARLDHEWEGEIIRSLPSSLHATIKIHGVLVEIAVRVSSDHEVPKKSVGLLRGFEKGESFLHSAGLDVGEEGTGDGGFV